MGVPDRLHQQDGCSRLDLVNEIIALQLCTPAEFAERLQYQSRIRYRYVKKWGLCKMMIPEMKNCHLIRRMPTTVKILFAEFEMMTMNTLLTCILSISGRVLSSPAKYCQVMVGVPVSIAYQLKREFCQTKAEKCEKIVTVARGSIVHLTTRHREDSFTA